MSQKRDPGGTFDGYCLRLRKHSCREYLYSKEGKQQNSSKINYGERNTRGRQQVGREKKNYVVEYGVWKIANLILTDKLRRDLMHNIKTRPAMSSDLILLQHR